MTVQVSKLAGALDLVIRGLNHQGALIVQLQEIGARHANYGTSETDFTAVGKALIMTLENGLSGAWTKDHEKSWTEAYSFISAQMLIGLRGRHAA